MNIKTVLGTIWLGMLLAGLIVMLIGGCCGQMPKIDGVIKFEYTEEEEETPKEELKGSE